MPYIKHLRFNYEITRQEWPGVCVALKNVYPDILWSGGREIEPGFYPGTKTLAVSLSNNHHVLSRSSLSLRDGDYGLPPGVNGSQWVKEHTVDTDDIFRQLYESENRYKYSVDDLEFFYKNGTLFYEIDINGKPHGLTDFARELGIGYDDIGTHYFVGKVHGEYSICWDSKRGEDCLHDRTEYLLRMLENGRVVPVDIYRGNITNPDDAINKLFESEEDNLDWAKQYVSSVGSRLNFKPPIGTKVRVRFNLNNDPCPDEDKDYNTTRTYEGIIVKHGDEAHSNEDDTLILFNRMDWQSECGWNCRNEELGSDFRCWWVNKDIDEIYLSNHKQVRGPDTVSGVRIRESEKEFISIVTESKTDTDINNYKPPVGSFLTCHTDGYMADMDGELTGDQFATAGKEYKIIGYTSSTRCREALLILDDKKTQHSFGVTGCDGEPQYLRWFYPSDMILPPHDDIWNKMTESKNIY